MPPRHSNERKIEDYSDEDFESMFKAFVMSPHYLNRALMSSMKEKHFGRIIRITSEVFYVGNPEFSAYVSAKGAHIGYLKSTAKFFRQIKTTMGMEKLRFRTP